MKKTILTTVAVCAGIWMSAQIPFGGDDLHVRPPQVPDYVVFASDTIRFDTAEKFERMDRELITFTNMHTLSTLMYRRSLRTFTLVTPILKEYGIPDDMKYLMAIESGLETRAVSPAGAAGLWQLMKGTARDLGLEVNTEVDQRFDNELATRAACRYLRNAYAEFGDWKLVAAGYNCGNNGVKVRMGLQRQKDYFDLWLPEETSRYLYRILAAKMFFANPSSFGFDVRDTDRYPVNKPRKTVTVSGPVPSLVDLAEQNGTTYAALKKANLWLRDSKITNKENKTYRIAIP